MHRERAGGMSAGWIENHLVHFTLSLSLSFCRYASDISLNLYSLSFSSFLIMSPSFHLLYIAYESLFRLLYTWRRLTVWNVNWILFQARFLIIYIILIIKENYFGLEKNKHKFFSMLSFLRFFSILLSLCRFAFHRNWFRTVQTR